MSKAVFSERQDFNNNISWRMVSAGLLRRENLKSYNNISYLRLACWLIQQWFWLVSIVYTG
jgi:hypothetical protein